MAFKGTQKRASGRIEKEVKSCGGYMNAATGLDATAFFITVPSEHFPEALELVSDIVMNPVFDNKELEKERQVILNEIKMRGDDPYAECLKLLFETSYVAHPYRFPVIGYKDLFESLKRDDLVEYHGKHYVPNNMVLSIAGDIDSAKASETVKKIFAPYKRRPAPIILNQAEPRQITERANETRENTSLGYAAIGYHTTSLLDKDLFSLDILAMALGMGDESRLNKALVKEKELLFSVSCSNYTPRYPGLFIVTGIGKPENLEGAVSEIKKMIYGLKNGGITKEEFEKAKANVISEYIEDLETTQSLADTMAEGQMMAGDPYFSRNYVEGIKAARLEGVLEVADRYLGDDNCTVVYVNKGGTDKSTETRVPALPAGRQRTEKEEGLAETKKYTLANGIRVILKENHKLPLASIIFSSLGGLRAEEESQSGISSLTSQMLLKGTKTRTEVDIKGAMEMMGADIAAFSGMNSFGVSVKCMSGDIGAALELLSDVIKNPVFPEEELNKLKNIVAADIKMQDDDIFENGFIELKKGLFKRHPYGRRILGEQESVSRLTRSDLVKFYENSLNPANTVITAVGDFDSEAMLKNITEKFSGIKGRELVITLQEEAALAGPEEKSLRMPKEQALAVLGFRGVDVKNDARYALEVISSILSGSDGRLFHSIRDSLGMSYTQGASQAAGIDPGYFILYAACDKKDINRAKQIIFDELKNIRSKPVSDEELLSAKNSLIGRHLMSLQTNDALALTMGLDELYSLGCENYKAFEENIQKCRKDDIIKAANIYFDINKSFSVIITSEEKS